MLKNLGKRLRTLRKDKGITLVELSKRTKIAQATLSRIETGVMTGTIESHELISEVLGIGLADLYTGIDSRYEQTAHLQKDAERRAHHQEKGVQIELLTAESSKKKITPLLITLSRNAETSLESQERGVEKFLYQLEGEVKVRVDQQEFTLKTGETLYFDASFPHKLSNPQDKPARTLVTVSPSKI
ncbi:MAG: XRE family transcriptional regulator [Candidatus Omnitrophota bacterium]|nr:XRE family transcriptional regulator [Candidatus Omnitrophota bacterium]